MTARYVVGLSVIACLVGATAAVGVTTYVETPRPVSVVYRPSVSGSNHNYKPRVVPIPAVHPAKRVMYL